MRFGAMLAALAALWVTPAEAVDIIDGIAPGPSGSAGVFRGDGDWVTVRFSKPVDTFKGKFPWFASIGESYCDETLSELCDNNYRDINGYDELYQVDDRTYRARYNVILDGWWLGTYVVNSQLAGNGLEFSYSHSYANAIRYQVIFADSIPEPTTWALMILGFGLIGHRLRLNSARSYRRSRR